MTNQDTAQITPYDNYATFEPTPNIASDNYTPKKQNAAVLFGIYGGFQSRRYPNLLFTQGVLCHLAEIAPISGEALDEMESVEVGKENYKSNRGYNYKTTLTVKGDAIQGIAAIVGFDFSSHAGSPYGGFLSSGSMPIAGDYGIRGCLIVHSTNDSKRMRTSKVLTQCRVWITNMATEQETYTVEIESKGRAIPTANGKMVVMENFLDNQNLGGTIINAFAPDGTTTVFKVGNGNESLLGASLPSGTGLPLCPINDKKTPLGVNPYDVTDPFYWFVEICRNGVPLTPDEVISYDYETGELTLAVAPADGDSLTLVYILPTGAPAFKPNQYYYVGETVKYNGDYYTCNTAYAGAWIALNWTVIPSPYVGVEWRPHAYGKGAGTMENPTYPTFMGYSWTLKNQQL